MRVSPADLYEYLLGNGLSRVHALGILANVKGESDFVVNIQERAPSAGRGGFGLFQHTGPRRRALEAYCGKDLGDWRKQVDFALSEPESELYRRKRFNSPADATEWWVRHWERPADPDKAAKRRIGYLPELTRLADRLV